jgi:hypothetical protein
MSDGARLSGGGGLTCDSTSETKRRPYSRPANGVMRG